MIFINLVLFFLYFAVFMLVTQFFLQIIVFKFLK